MFKNYSISNGSNLFLKSSVLLDHNEKWRYYRGSHNKFTCRSRIINVDSESGQSNRLFIIIAVAMLGLICIGLMGLGGVLFFTLNNRAQEAAVIAVTPTVILPTFTPTGTPTATPTETPLPTSTSTPVIKVSEGEGGGTTPHPTPTNTGVLQPATETPTPTPAAAAEMPSSGGVLSAGQNSYLIWAGLGLVFLLIVGVVKQFRSFSPKP